MSGQQIMSDGSTSVAPGFYLCCNQIQSGYGPNAIKRYNGSKKGCFGPLQKMSMSQVCNKLPKIYN